MNSEVINNHIKWMKHALKLAERSKDEGEVPVGAVIVKDGELIAEGWNQPIDKHDATAHAEIMAIRAAGIALENYRLPNTTLYVTLEPCTMCAGAIIHARIEKLVFGAPDPRTGSAGSAVNVFGGDYHNHLVEVEGGVMQAECGQILKDFFRERRKKKNDQSL
ncbi:MAG: tRNA adenosine(34) deaminase TadA [Cocleimonas sp.]